MSFYSGAVERYHERLRRLDERILWPAIRDQAPTPELAKEAFLAHACHDPSWLRLGPTGIATRVMGLPEVPHEGERAGAGKQHPGVGGDPG